jgi:hypothetical protein
MRQVQVRMQNKARYRYIIYGFFSLYVRMLHLPPSDSTVSEDAGIEPRTVATLVLTARCSARSHRHPLFIFDVKNTSLTERW